MIKKLLFLIFLSFSFLNYFSLQAGWFVNGFSALFEKLLVDSCPYEDIKHSYVQQVYFDHLGNEDASKEWQNTFDDVLQKSNIPEKVNVKLREYPDSAPASVFYIPGHGNVLYINKEKMKQVEAVGKERLDAVLYHEAGHVQANHSKEGRDFRAKTFLGTLLSPFVSLGITKGITKMNLKSSLAISGATIAATGITTTLAGKRLNQLQEMEADLIAVKNAHKKDILDFCNGDEDDNDGVHPTTDELIYYALRRFEKELFEGKSPNPRKHAQQYVLERRLFDPFWKKNLD